VKRNDSPWSSSEFGGFVAAPSGAFLTKPAARSRQVEFIGDSLTVGYGDRSTNRGSSMAAAWTPAAANSTSPPATTGSSPTGSRIHR
jgi:hypothetical protein